VVDKVVDRRGTRKAAEAYLQFLYTDDAQEIIAKNFYRPVNEAVAQKFATQFPKIELVTIADFGGWQKAQATHFAEGGVFDQITLK
jgi:ABC-type sulfate transport system substrate-binding protein